VRRPPMGRRAVLQQNVAPLQDAALQQNAALLPGVVLQQSVAAV
jgi:hypothetical protein